MGEGDYEDVDFIVEPRFREQWQISHPTERYSRVLAAVPHEFVGTASHLIPLVQDISSELALSFESKGMTLPPWRKNLSMLSKWLPAQGKVRDTSFSRGSSDSAYNESLSGPLAHVGPPLGGGCLLSSTSSADCSSSKGGSLPPKSLLSSKLQLGGAARTTSTSPSQWVGQPPIHKVRIGFVQPTAGGQ